MRQYIYYPEFDANDLLLWHVKEQTTGQIIESFFFEEDAEEFCTKLESGAGFAGFTPAFMLVKVGAKDINQAFAMEFSE